MIQVKNKTKIKITIYVILSITVLSAIYFIFFFNLFDIERNLIASFSLVNSKDKIEIYQIPSTATTNNNIQIVIKDVNNKHNIIRVIENFELVKNIRIIDTNSVVLELGDKYSFEKLKTDSVIIVNIK